MGNFDKLYTDLMESMSRRDFLGVIGKGASIAGVSPGSIIKGITNLVSTDISKYSEALMFVLHPSGSGASMVSKMGASYAFLSKFVHQMGININPFDELKKDFSVSFDGVDMQNNEEVEGAMDSFFEIYETGVYDPIDFSIAHNLVTPTMFKFFKDDLGTDMTGFKITPAQWEKKYKEYIKSKHSMEQEWKDYEENERKRNQINYHRSEYAGGSEDAEYAKHYDESKARK